VRCCGVAFRRGGFCPHPSLHPAESVVLWCVVSWPDLNGQVWEPNGRTPASIDWDEEEDEEEAEGEGSVEWAYEETFEPADDGGFRPRDRIPSPWCGPCHRRPHAPDPRSVGPLFFKERGNGFHVVVVVGPRLSRVPLVPGGFPPPTTPLPGPSPRAASSSCRPPCRPPLPHRSPHRNQGGPAARARSAGPLGYTIAKGGRGVGAVPWNRRYPTVVRAGSGGRRRGSLSPSPPPPRPPAGHSPTPPLPPAPQLGAQRRSGC